jgi:hypothetical protein
MNLGFHFFMEIYNLYKNSYKRDEKSINLKNKSGAKSDDDKYRENNTIFTLLNEDVLRECIARVFAVRGYKVTAEVLYKNNKKGGSLDLLITDEKEQGENNKYYALELKIEKDKDTCGSGIRDIILDAHRLVIDKENNYRKEILDSQKYTVLLVDPKYIYKNIENKRRRKWRWDFYEKLLDVLINKDEGKKVELNEIHDKIKEIVNDNEGKYEKNNDTKKWLDCSEKMKEIKLTIKRKITIDNSNNNKIEIILFKCEKNKTDNENKNEISNS